MIIIDAYNLLKQIIKSSEATERERRAFIDDISLYAKNKNVDVLLVFDGGSSPRTELFNKFGIKIVYSGYQASADDYIKEYIIKNHRFSILLVSSDRALYAVASRYRITTIDALAFYALMQEEFAKKPKILMQKSNAQAQKLHVDEINVELDQLMFESDYVLLKDEAQQKERNTAKSLTKKEKKLLKIIKKL